MDHVMNQKYLPLQEMRAGYPRVIEKHLQGAFPEKIVEELRGLLDRVDRDPLIVRSSSLLEDNFGYAFAGKYNSYFLPNQGSKQENLADVNRLQDLH